MTSLFAYLIFLMTACGYDPVGNLRHCSLPNGLHSFHQYDALNRLTNLNVSRLIGTMANYAYTVNPSGHRSSAVETIIRNPLNPQPFTISRLYRYDPTYRLTNETISATAMPAPAALDYHYDAVGNRLELASTLGEIPSASYGYDFNDRLLSDTYDNNGNTLSAPGFGMAQPDRYDFENRLLQRTVAGKTVTIVYDGDGNRIRKTITTATNTATTFYLVDMVNPTGYAQVLEELRTTDNGPLTLDRVYAIGHALLSQWYPTESFVRYHGLDGHGNTRFLTDWQGEITDTYDYDAFGNLIAATGSTPNHFLFTSEQFDSDLGLYFLRARYHDTTTGRFWTVDEFEGASHDPLSLHKYLYALDNPITYGDPSGYFSISELGNVVRVIGNLARLAAFHVGRVILTASRTVLNLLSRGVSITTRSGKVLVRALKLRTGGVAGRPSYEILKIRNVLRLEAHPIRGGWPWWFFYPHAHVDLLGAAVSSLHIPIAETAVGLYLLWKALGDDEPQEENPNP